MSHEVSSRAVVAAAVAVASRATTAAAAMQAVVAVVAFLPAPVVVELESRRSKPL